MTANNHIVRLGDYIEARNERNSDLRYGVELIEGVNSDGEFQPTKAVTDGIDMKPYKAVYEGDIVYNPSRLNIGSLAYREKGMGMCIVSHLYQVFHIKKEYAGILLPEYLLLFFRRKEFSRVVDYYNFGSQRAEFNLNKLGELKISIPPIDTQYKIVNAWKALREIKEQNESIAEPLMQVCRSYIQKIKHKYPSSEIGQYIVLCDERNTLGRNLPIMGINIDKIFMPTVANTDGVNIKNYKIVKKGRFVFSGMQTGRDQCIRTGLYTASTEALVSPAYTTYSVDESKGLISGYLDLVFKRKEMDRLGAFYSDASVRANLEWPRFLQIQIPIPPIEIQQAIVNIYNCALEARHIAEEADIKSREICPALIQYAIQN